MVRDIASRRLLIAKAALFVLLGIGAAGILIAEVPRVSTVLLLAIAIWAFARAYYFAFYVIEHYIDGTYRFAGLWSAVAFLVYSGRRNHP